MRYSLLLARRYLAHHRVRTAILVLCIALVFALPIAVTLLVDHFEKVLVQRARSVPQLVGAKGSRYDLLLSALYFRGRCQDLISMAEVDSLREGGLAAAVPVLTGHTAGKGHPVVGTTLDYFDRTGLRVRAGSLPLMLGDAVLGADVARRLGLGPGDRLTSDTRKVHDISSSYPLDMRVSGVLLAANTPDDGAVFVDVKTAWILNGIGHGHQDVVREVDEAAVEERSDSNVRVDTSIKQTMRVTRENIDSFHFHGDPAEYPVTAILVWPHDRRGAIKLSGRYKVSETAQMLAPEKVVNELLGFVFRMKRFFDANVVMVSVATALFLALIVLLSLRIRRREMETLFKIGCSRGTVVRLQAIELLIVLAAGLALAAVLSGLVLWYMVHSHSVL